MTAPVIEIHDGVAAAMNRLLAAGRDLTPANRAIAQLLLARTEANLAAEAGPGGPWPALSAAVRKRRGAGAKALQDTGRLAASVTPFWGEAEAGIGSNAVYAAIHHLGGDIERTAYSSWVRLRTDQAGNLLRQDAKSGLAVFAKDRHKRAKTVRYTTEGHVTHIPPRPYFPATAAGLQAGVTDDIMAELARYLLGEKTGAA